MDKEILVAVTIGIGLAASCGFRVFVPMLVATGEYAAAFGTSILSLFTPFVVAILVILLIIYLVVKFGRKLFRGRNKELYRENEHKIYN